MAGLRQGGVMVVACVALGACAGSVAVPDEAEAEWNAAGPELPPPAMFSIEMTTPSPGALTTITATGVTAGFSVKFIRGSGPGAGACPGPLLGECLDILDAKLLGSSTADAAGTASLSITIPATVPAGATLWVQAVAISGPDVEISDVISGTLVSDCELTDDGSAPEDWAAFECDVVRIVNDVRAVGGDCGSLGPHPPVDPLTMNASLRLAARVHTQWMVDTDTFSHDSPGGPFGDDLVERAETAGYTGWSVLAENLALGAPTPSAAVEGWMLSDFHCTNLLNASVEDVGVGYVEDEFGTAWWTLVAGATF